MKVMDLANHITSCRIDNHAPKAYIHPHILKRMEGYEQMINLERSSKTCTTAESDDHVETESFLTALSHARSLPEATNDDNEESIKKQWEQLEAAERDGILKLAPEDEIEGEVLVLQNALLSCAKENRGRCGMSTFIYFEVVVTFIWVYNL
jgi:hypothetical protein